MLSIDLARPGRPGEQDRGGFLRGKEQEVIWIDMSVRREISPHSQALGKHDVDGEEELVYRGEVRKGSRDCSREELDANSTEGGGRTAFIGVAHPGVIVARLQVLPRGLGGAPLSPPPLEAFSVVYVRAPKQL